MHQATLEVHDFGSLRVKHGHPSATQHHEAQQRAAVDAEVHRARQRLERARRDVLGEARRIAGREAVGDVGAQRGPRRRVGCQIAGKRVWERK